MPLEAAKIAVVDSDNRTAETPRNEYPMNKHGEGTARRLSLKDLPPNGVPRKRLQNGLRTLRAANESKVIWKGKKPEGAISEVLRHAKSVWVEMRGDPNVSGAVLGSNSMQPAKPEYMMSGSLLPIAQKNDFPQVQQDNIELREAGSFDQRRQEQQASIKQEMPANLTHPKQSGSNQRQQSGVKEKGLSKANQKKPDNLNREGQGSSNQRGLCNTLKLTKQPSVADLAMLKTGSKASTNPQANGSEDGAIESHLRREEPNNTMQRYAIRGKQLAIISAQLYWEIISPCFDPTSPLRQRLNTNKSTWWDLLVVFLALIGSFMLLAVAIRVSRGIAWATQLMQTILGV
ncbi:hypothetical protein CkaCkLH20_12933 [Colletotrichum karsti]|uniref:Uncharacterized protein n=1 Tax=Colletotrichum karsti TaxID=1095194 RepID=A0A9P6HTC0_9PEZI|nr:uncharacterized protein CkaCkLH20_12933 [Colletotrichum karsti]KAF9869540.1 hypothetical protein CkaCkLH20_12933 [Colletotrichum karsti]